MGVIELGYKFSFNEINTVALLIEGRVTQVIEEMLYSRENYLKNCEYLTQIVRNFEMRFFSADERYYFRKVSDAHYLLHELNELDIHKMEHLWTAKNNQTEMSLTQLISFPEVLELQSVLIGFCKLFGNSKINAILLPGLENNLVNNYLMSEELLINLVQVHPKDSCLILQPEKMAENGHISIFNAFSKMSLALNSINEWPGIFLWNKRDSIFIPLPDNISNLKSMLDYIFICIHQEKEPLKALRKLQNPRSYTYLLHLSDLHFGYHTSTIRKSRLLKLIEKVMAQAGEDSSFLPIITGDLVDTPSKDNFNEFDEFISSLLKRGLKDPIYVYGNHDLYNSGLRSGKFKESKLRRRNLDSGPLVILSDLRLIIIRVDSNAEDTGFLAEGKIGEAQRIHLGNLLDDVEDINDYTCIVLLHHHPVSIDDPEWYRPNVFERLFPVLAEHALKLKDSEIFLDWVEKRKVKLVLHGHKHIPNVTHSGMSYIIACGSSTGKVGHIRRGWSYLTFNLIKYDNQLGRVVSCTTYFEDNQGSGLQHLNTFPIY